MLFFSSSEVFIFVFELIWTCVLKGALYGGSSQRLGDRRNAKCRKSFSFYEKEEMRAFNENTQLILRYQAVVIGWRPSSPFHISCLNKKLKPDAPVILFQPESLSLSLSLSDCVDRLDTATTARRHWGSYSSSFVIVVTIVDIWHVFHVNSFIY